MKYFYDCEFYEDGSTIDLISIGIVAEDGRELYACSTDAQLHRVSPWVRENVLPKLPPYSSERWMTRSVIRDEIIMFTGDMPEGYPPSIALRDFVNPSFHYKLDGLDEDMQLWGYYSDYDHICLCQLFGKMMQLPEHFPKYTLDLKQLSVSLGSPKHPPNPADEHNALDDARWNRDLYSFLMKEGARDAAKR